MLSATKHEEYLTYSWDPCIHQRRSIIKKKDKKKGSVQDKDTRSRETRTKI
jgi:hypothetical protein